MLVSTLALALAWLSVPGAADEAGLCAPSAQVLELSGCPAQGPGAYRAQFAAAQYPAAPADLPLQPLPRPEQVLDAAYARVVTANAPAFASPEAAAAGGPSRSLGRGWIFVQLTGAAAAGELALYRIRSGEFVRAADVQPVEPSRFRGVTLNARPALPFGWMVAAARPSPAPGVPAPRSRARLPRYRLVTIYGQVRLGAWNWYLVGPDEWVEQRVVSVVALHAPPDGVSGRWVQVDLYEQNLVAYQDDQPVFATLVSTGLNSWPTRPGLFQIYARLADDRMQGAYRPDRSDYYSLEAVPYVMYFDGDRALHGEYWHDRLGLQRSHGCVNLSPLDARWLYAWTSKGTSVWVYNPYESDADAATAAPAGP